MSDIQPFPSISLGKEDSQQAYRLYGRRFHQGQDLIEYLAEFLLVFLSPKGSENTKTEKGFPQSVEVFYGNENSHLIYYPQASFFLKFFTFFPNSKLDTRHPAHRKKYNNLIQSLKQHHIDCENDNRSEEVLKLIQSFFSGLAGVTNQRTWVSQTFMPLHSSLIGREVMWGHGKDDLRKAQGKAALRGEQLDWEATLKFFETNRHNFFARGGEALYLQILNLHHNPEFPKELEAPVYKHLKQTSIPQLIENLESCLQSQLVEIEHIRELTDLLNRVMQEEVEKPNSIDNKAICGWVPRQSRPEALLFAWEMENICRASVSAMDKMEWLAILCVMQVLRSMCFQSRRFQIEGDNHHSFNTAETVHFAGNYVWVVTVNDLKAQPVHQLALRNYRSIEALHQSAMRNPVLISTDSKRDDKDGFKLFRKLGKALNLVTPKSGGNMHFTLPNEIIRFLIPALIPPGQKMTFDSFCNRLFAHYGIALSSQHLQLAERWQHDQKQAFFSREYWSAPVWFTDALQANGYYIPLSDAVSIVENPFGGEA